MRAALLALALLALPAAAAEPGPPMTGDQFDAFSRGKTFYYTFEGEPYGAEQYLPGRKVIWAFTGEECKRGTWYEQGRFICFVYDDEPAPQCWTFFDTPDGLVARFEDDPNESALIGVEESAEPLFCPGPDVGV